MASAALLLAFCVHTQAVRPSLAPYVPAMSAPVVNVRATRELATGGSLPFIGRLLPKGNVSSIGSGVIIDPRGLVLTNHHIVDGAKLVKVQLSDEREYLAEVIGRDPPLDLALLQVHTDERLPFARFGRSRSMQVGDYVVAVGNPFGLDHTVTMGIVSARGRVLGVGPQAPLLQTDASINPGNSGGPLYDLGGRVIGINTAIVAGAHGIGFAVPVDVVRRALPQLRRRGHIDRGFAGVRSGRVPPDVARAMNLSPARGALLLRVMPDGPGARGGLQPGDVILQWDDYSIDSSDTLPWVVALTPPGTRVRVRLLRLGVPMVLDIRTSAPPRVELAPGVATMGLKSPEFERKVSTTSP
jgi:serine protease Do